MRENTWCKFGCKIILTLTLSHTCALVEDNMALSVRLCMISRSAAGLKMETVSRSDDIARRISGLSWVM
eukprot:m.28798 g.28798  ORF g.28798 m.28798 type:complete len:69 (-) comp8035_c0_seq2:1004-1210(-)